MARPFKCNRDLNGDRIVIRVCLDDLRKSCGDYMFRKKLAALVLVGFVLSTKSAMAGCVTLDRSSNGIADFFINHCSESIYVKFSDSGMCAGYTCGVTGTGWSKGERSQVKGTCRMGRGIIGSFER